MANFSSFFPAAGGGGGTPPGTYYIEYLAVGGGGGGASKATGGAGGGGGGGAGGFINNFFVTPAGVVTTISVGGGGAGAPAGENNGNDGYPTLIGSNAIGVISGVNAVGGGGGGMGGGGAFVKPGRTGGSSGGSCNGTFTDPSLPSTNSQTYGLLIQGGSGKNGNGTVQGGAGGSAGTTQLLAPNTALCHSDDGAMTTIINSSNATTSSVGEINATNVYFSSGGAGHARSYGGTGTAGVGGGGNSTNALAYPGTANTGGGGGGILDYAYGNSTYPGGAGGSGVAILRMETTNYTGTTTGSPDVYTEGDFTVLVYTGSGTYTT